MKIINLKIVVDKSYKKVWLLMLSFLCKNKKEKSWQKEKDNIKSKLRKHKHSAGRIIKIHKKDKICKN